MIMTYIIVYHTRLLRMLEHEMLIAIYWHRQSTLSPVFEFSRKHALPTLLHRMHRNIYLSLLTLDVQDVSAVMMSLIEPP